MKWDQLLSTKRLGLEAATRHKDSERTEFQRDYDRLIFSSPFRRLQNKTQVFPLPGSTLVHNRLTHSLEVASVARSLGNSIVGKLADNQSVENCKLFPELGSAAAAACLAHDMGNPPFGHSGEETIRSFFEHGEGRKYQERYAEEEWLDLIYYEGNANAFRLLTNQFNGKREGGFALTYTTLAAIVKYPYASNLAHGKRKFGYFKPESTTFQKVANELGIPQLANGQFARHPVVFLVEAADDICYQIMDIEDAFKLKIIDKNTCIKLLMSFLQSDAERHDKIIKKGESLGDTNEQIAYYRSCAIGQLVKECTEAFVENLPTILKGTFDSPLIKSISPLNVKNYNQNAKFSVQHIYKSSHVVDIEISGHRILNSLLENFLEAALKGSTQQSYSSKLLLSKIPSQYEVDASSDYLKTLAVLDFISSMTDNYALDLYRTIQGIETSRL